VSYALLRSALFRLEPEAAHALAMAGLAFSSRHPGLLRVLRAVFMPPDPRLRVRCFGLEFANPLGLGAGFDKGADAPAVWPALGFGTADLGTVTALPQPGNPRPRAFRLPAERAIINRMGFNNPGAAVVAARIAAERSRPWWPAAPLGVNVGKSRAAALDEAVADYEQAMRAVWPVADYLVLNVSSPNTPGLRSLHQRAHLQPLVALVERLRDDLGPRPVLLKVSPDLDESALDELVAVAGGLDGFVATNTTIARDTLRHDPGEAGGLSGPPLAPRALAVLRALRARTRLPLVASGGIETAADVIERLEAGASLVHVYTGWIYEGPFMARAVARGLLDWLDALGWADLQAYLDARDARDAAPGAAVGARLAVPANPEHGPASP
jgi:dihydroorotate dehydrogenase